MQKIQRITIGDNAYAYGLHLSMENLPLLRTIEMGSKAFGAYPTAEGNTVTFSGTAFLV